MARRYAPEDIPGLAGQVQTHVDGEIVMPGDELPEGTETFDVTYWYSPTPVDIAAGAIPGTRLNVALYEVPVTASDAEIRAAIMELRARNREFKNFGSKGTVGIFIS